MSDHGHTFDGLGVRPKIYFWSLRLSPTLPGARPETSLKDLAVKAGLI